MKIQDFIMNGRDFHDDRSRFLFSFFRVGKKLAH